MRKDLIDTEDVQPRAEFNEALNNFRKAKSERLHESDAHLFPNHISSLLNTSDRLIPLLLIFISMKKFFVMFQTIPILFDEKDLQLLAKFVLSVPRHNQLESSLYSRLEKL